MSHADPALLEHLKRLEQALFNSYDLNDVVRYLEEKTFLKGDRFSFVDHEFQKDIISDTSRTLYVQKCAQVGLSECMARYALAVSRVMPYFSVILTLPFANDATNFTKTRLDPIIDESPDLRDSVDKDLDNASIKSIGTSLLYMRGCSGSTTALSVPADMLIHDEVDRSDPDTLAQFQSRIKHSRWKLTRRFGTPTTEGRGIALEMATARRMRRACTCCHCGTQFVPNFHQHVKIPDYFGEFKDINKHNIDSLRWQEARLHCPGCDNEPDLSPQYRQWICENPDDNYEAIGYYVTPFEVPNIVTVPSLIMEITKYKTWAEFVNQALGETADAGNAQLTEADVEQCKYTAGSLDSSELHAMGIDVGQTCHLAIGRRTLDGRLLVTHREQVPLAKLAVRRRELAAKWRVLITVVDAFPETNLVHQMQRQDKNLYGGVYVNNLNLSTYEIKMVDKDEKEGKLPINQAKINRDVNFDEVMALYKAGMISWVPMGDHTDKLWVLHMLDMKRTQIFDKHQEIVYTWVKSKEGNDHFMHTLGYLHVASQLMATASRDIPFTGVNMFGTFRVRH
jgi:hypothetical protein